MGTKIAFGVVCSLHIKKLLSFYTDLALEGKIKLLTQLNPQNKFTKLEKYMYLVTSYFYTHA